MLQGRTAAISIQVSPYYVFSNFCGTMWYSIVQPIAVAVLETFVMMNKDGALHPSICWLSFLQSLKEYEIITSIYKI